VQSGPCPASALDFGPPQCATASFLGTGRSVLDAEDTAAIMEKTWDLL
jgi:hypothetical protein